MPVTRIFQSYQKMLHQRPYVVQSAQTVILMTTGDIISQTCIEKKNITEVNYYRAMKFGSIGFIMGPALTSWYKFLENFKLASKPLTLVKKITLDQLIFAPSALATVTTIVSLTDGKTVDEIKNKFKADYFHMLAANYKLWPFVQYVNLSIVPLNYRVLVVQIVAIAWNTYLSWKLNSESEPEQT